MPAPRSEHLLEDALQALGRALDGLGRPWMIIGGLAAIARGVRRFTTDIDAAVRGDGLCIDEVVGILDAEAIRPRIEDAAAFARANLVLLVRHEPTGIDLDVSLAWSSFEHEALAAATPCRFGRVELPVVTADDLVVFKGIAGRSKDEEDIVTLLALHPSIDRDRARQRLVALAALAEAPELVEAFDAILGRVPRAR